MNFTLPKVPSSLSLSLGYTEARSLIFTIAKKINARRDRYSRQPKTSCSTWLVENICIA